MEIGPALERRLREERIAWLVTVDPDGAPRPVPIWFLWDGEEALVYSEPRRAKLRNIDANDRVAFHFDSDGEGGAIAVLRGRARRSDDPPANEAPEFIAKYDWGLRRNGWTPREFAERYSVPIRFRPESAGG